MPSLDDPALIQKYDRSNMMGLIASFPRQCRVAKKIALAFDLPRSYKKRYENIVCTGLGGSAIGADIMRSYILDSAKTPLAVNRGYLLPGFVSSRSLVIVSSYSGDTEETLSAYKDARRKGANIVAITSGGCLRKMAKADGFPVLVIPGGLPPRAALGYSSITLLTVLSKSGIIKDQSSRIDEAIAVMTGLQDEKIGLNVSQKNNIAKTIVAALINKYPVIYGAQDRIDAVVTRWRGQLAENAKTLASSHFFPEMNHNEIVGWDHPAAILKDCAVIILRDGQDHPRVAKRMDITEKLIRTKCASITEVHSSGKGLLARIFSLVYTGDYVSFYLAMLNKCDPTPVERIAYLKKQLSGKK
jgi:glucose/mannose-6-phosphate isomerase